MGSMGGRNPRALSSALAILGTLQPWALGFLHSVDPLDTVIPINTASSILVYNLGAKAGSEYLTLSLGEQSILHVHE